MRLVLLQYCSRVTARMQTSLTWLVCVVSLFVVWQVSVCYSRHEITWHLYAAASAAAAPLASLLACMHMGARANLEHAKHANALVQHRLLLRTSGPSASAAGGAAHAHYSPRLAAGGPPDPVDDLLQVGSELVRNTDPLTCVGFDATQELFKATVSALATAIVVVGVSLLGPDATLSARAAGAQAATFAAAVPPAPVAAG